MPDFIKYTRTISINATMAVTKVSHNNVRNRLNIVYTE